MKLLIAFFVFIVSFNLVCSQSLRYKRKCVPWGCFNQHCAEASFISHSCPETPEPEALCKKHAKCERQFNGKCGWTETKASQACLQRERKKKTK